jgi:guanylate kinase
MVANPADSVDGNYHLCWKAYERNPAMNTLINSIPTIAALLAVSAALARIVLTGNRSLAKRIDDTNLRIDGVEKSLTVRIDGVEKRLTVRIDSVETNLGKRIDENSSEIRAMDAKFSNEFIAVNQRFDSVNQRIDKALDLAIR